MQEGDTITSPSWTNTDKVLTVGNQDILVVDDIEVTSGLASLVERDPVLVKVTRIGTHGSDTSTSAWELYAVVVRYRCNSVGRYP